VAGVCTRVIAHTCYDSVEIVSGGPGSLSSERICVMFTADGMTIGWHALVLMRMRASRFLEGAFRRPSLEVRVRL
jgi:hypothetical protein